MVTKTQIDRLSSRIESLAAVHRPMRFAVIHVGVDETEEAAKERHYRNHPEDRNASDTIIVQWVAAKEGRPVTCPAE
jgi:hypothetical protein